MGLEQGYYFHDYLERMYQLTAEKSASLCCIAAISL
jgi:hypothetical protein